MQTGGFGRLLVLVLCVRKGPESVETTLMTFPSLGPSPEPWANGCIPVLWCNLYKKQLSPFHRCRNQGSQSFSQLLDNDRAGFASPHTCPAVPAGIISPSPSPVCFFPWSMLVCVCGGGRSPCTSLAASLPPLLSPQPPTKDSFSPHEACHKVPTSWRCLRGTLFPFGFPSALQPRK